MGSKHGWCGRDLQTACGLNIVTWEEVGSEAFAPHFLSLTFCEPSCEWWQD